MQPTSTPPRTPGRGVEIHVHGTPSRPSASGLGLPSASASASASGISGVSSVTAPPPPPSAPAVYAAGPVSYSSTALPRDAGVHGLPSDMPMPSAATGAPTSGGVGLGIDASSARVDPTTRLDASRFDSSRFDSSRFDSSRYAVGRPDGNGSGVGLSSAARSGRAPSADTSAAWAEHRVASAQRDTALERERLVIEAQQQVRDLLPLKERCAKAEADLELAAERVRAKTQQVDTVQSMLRHEREEADTTLESLRQELRDARDDLAQERSRAADQIQELQRREREQVEMVEQLRTDLATAKAATEQNATVSLRSDRMLAQARMEAEQAQARADAAARAVTDRDAAVGSSEGRCRALEETLRDLEEKHEQLKRDHGDLSAEAARLISSKAQLADRATSLAEDAKDAHELRSRIAELTAKVSEGDRAKATTAGLDEALTRERQRNRELEKRHEISETRILALERELHQVNSDLTLSKQAEAEATVVKKDRDTRVEQLAAAREQLLELQSQANRDQAASHVMGSENARKLRELAAEVDRLQSAALAALAANGADATNTHALRSRAIGNATNGSYATADNAASGVSFDASNVANGINVSNVNASTAMGAGVSLIDAGSSSAAAALAAPSVHSPSRALAAEVLAPTDIVAPLRAAVQDLSDALRNERASSLQLQKRAQETSARCSELEADARKAERSEATKGFTVSALERQQTETAGELAQLSQQLRETRASNEQNLRLLRRTVGAAESAPDAGSWTVAQSLVAAAVADSAAARSENEHLHQKLHELSVAAAESKHTADMTLESKTVQSAAAAAEAVATQTALKDALSKAVLRNDEAAAELARLESEAARLQHEKIRAETDLLDARAQIAARDSALYDERSRRETTTSQLNTAVDATAEQTTVLRGLNTNVQKLEEERDSLVRMLGCVVPALTRLRTDAREVLIHRRLLQRMLRDHEGAFNALRASMAADQEALVMAHLSDPQNQPRLANQSHNLTQQSNMQAYSQSGAAAGVDVSATTGASFGGHPSHDFTTAAHASPAGAGGGLGGLGGTSGHHHSFDDQKKFGDASNAFGQQQQQHQQPSFHSTPNPQMQNPNHNHQSHMMDQSSFTMRGGAPNVSALTAASSAHPSFSFAAPTLRRRPTFRTAVLAVLAANRLLRISYALRGGSRTGAGHHSYSTSSAYASLSRGPRRAAFRATVSGEGASPERNAGPLADTTLPEVERLMRTVDIRSRNATQETVAEQLMHCFVTVAAEAEAEAEDQMNASQHPPNRHVSFEDHSSSGYMANFNAQQSQQSTDQFRSQNRRRTPEEEADRKRKLDASLLQQLRGGNFDLDLLHRLERGQIRLRRRPATPASLANESSVLLSSARSAITADVAALRTERSQLQQRLDSMREAADTAETQAGRYSRQVAELIGTQQVQASKVTTTVEALESALGNARADAERAGQEVQEVEHELTESKDREAALLQERHDLENEVRSLSHQLHQETQRRQMQEQLHPTTTTAASRSPSLMSPNTAGAGYGTGSDSAIVGGAGCGGQSASGTRRTSVIPPAMQASSMSRRSSGGGGGGPPSVSAFAPTAEPSPVQRRGTQHTVGSARPSVAIGGDAESFRSDFRDGMNAQSQSQSQSQYQQSQYDEGTSPLDPPRPSVFSAGSGAGVRRALSPRTVALQAPSLGSSSIPNGLGMGPDSGHSVGMQMPSLAASGVAQNDVGGQSIGVQAPSLGASAMSGRQQRSSSSAAPHFAQPTHSSALRSVDGRPGHSGCSVCSDESFSNDTGVSTVLQRGNPNPNQSSSGGQVGSGGQQQRSRGSSSVVQSQQQRDRSRSSSRPRSARGPLSVASASNTGGSSVGGGNGSGSVVRPRVPSHASTTSGAAQHERQPPALASLSQEQQQQQQPQPQQQHPQVFAQGQGQGQQQQYAQVAQVQDQGARSYPQTQQPGMGQSYPQPQQPQQEFTVPPSSARSSSFAGVSAPSYSGRSSMVGSPSGTTGSSAARDGGAFRSSRGQSQQFQPDSQHLAGQYGGQGPQQQGQQQRGQGDASVEDVLDMIRGIDERLIGALATARTQNN